MEENNVDLLYDTVKKTVWLVDVTGTKAEEPLRGSLTGFAVSGRLLMTCAHGVCKDWDSLSIKVRPVAGKGVYKASPVFSRTDCDVCILSVEGLTEDMSYGDFGPGSLAVGEIILLVGNPLKLIGSGVFVTVQYPCIANPEFSLNEDSPSCEEFVVDSRERPHPYRIIGNFWNQKYLVKSPTFEKNVIARLPVIQYAVSRGTKGISPGSSGGPLFDQNGLIVGMSMGASKVFSIAVHSSVLRELLHNYLNIAAQRGVSSGGVRVSRGSSAWQSQTWWWWRWRRMWLGTGRG